MGSTFLESLLPKQGCPLRYKFISHGISTLVLFVWNGVLNTSPLRIRRVCVLAANQQRWLLRHGRRCILKPRMVRSASDRESHLGFFFQGPLEVYSPHRAPRVCAWVEKRIYEKVDWVDGSRVILVAENWVEALSFPREVSGDLYFKGWWRW